MNFYGGIENPYLNLSLAANGGAAEPATAVASSPHDLNLSYDCDMRLARATMLPADVARGVLDEILLTKLNVWIARHWSLMASALLHAAAIAALLIVLPKVLTPPSHSDAARDAISIEITQLTPPPAPSKAAPDAAEAPPILQNPTSGVVLPVSPKKVVAVPKPKPVVAPPVEAPAPIVFDNPSLFITTPMPAPSPVANATPAGLAGTSPDYLDQVRQRLERNKTYPRIAELRRQEGDVMLRFTIDRSGHVLRHVIDRSSGHTLLDRETESMLARSDPLPPVPPELTGATFEIVVPVHFDLSDLGPR